MNIEVELSRIIIDEASDQQVIVLKEKNGSRSLPIIIGIVEIMAIERRLKKMITPRPLTHDLLNNIIESLGADIDKVVINDIRNHTYYATIYLNVDSRKIEIDSRPSDAIALTASSTIPLYVAEHVFEGE
ncbi:MAG: bifunctional nuclease family protein [Phycisphaerales bacterium]